MSGPIGGDVVYRRPGRDDHLSVAAWILPGRPEHVAGVRRWAQAVAGSWGVSGTDVGLVVSELVTNALKHTRSGQPGGTVTVAIAGRWCGVTVHVHDLGADSGRVSRLRLTAVDGDGLSDGGRGLQIVAGVGAEWGTLPAAWCPVWGPGDPAADSDGSCTWCHMANAPEELDDEERAERADR